MNYYFCGLPDLEIQRQREIGVALYKHALLKEKGVADLDLVKDERGKPYIPGTNLHMSLSHCKSGVACVIADEPVGIDVEEISRFTALTIRRVSRRICTQRELLRLQGLSALTDKQDFLCRLWVLKESYSKMTGEGLSFGFSAIETVEHGDRFFAKRNGNLYIGLASEKAFTQEPREITVGASELLTS